MMKEQILLKQILSNQKPNTKNYSPSHISLKQLFWNYKFIGCHRLIELKFYCSNCNSNYYALLDKKSYIDKKTSKLRGRKNIQMKTNNFNNIHCQVTTYKVTKNMSYEKCFQDFDSIDASDYNISANNCVYFAYKIKNKILNIKKKKKNLLYLLYKLLQ